MPRSRPDASPRPVWRLRVLTALLLAILIAAHTVGAIQGLAFHLWRVLSVFGVDVAMTPLTFDMMLMYDPASRTNAYQHSVEVRYATPEGVLHVPVNTLSFYRWRVPAILFVEEWFWKTNTRAHVYALCHELARTHGPGAGFEIHMDGVDAQMQAYGLNQEHACP